MKHTSWATFLANFLGVSMILQKKYIYIYIYKSPFWFITLANCFQADAKATLAYFYSPFGARDIVFWNLDILWGEEKQNENTVWRGRKLWPIIMCENLVIQSLSSCKYTASIFLQSVPKLSEPCSNIFWSYSVCSDIHYAAFAYKFWTNLQQNLTANNSK